MLPASSSRRRACTSTCSPDCVNEVRLRPLRVNSRNPSSSSSCLICRDKPGWVACTCSARSEEHTSELQSPVHLVCRLLLEKKKKKRQLHLNLLQLASAAL